MKMINSSSSTSMRGVTLISLTALRVPFPASMAQTSVLRWRALHEMSERYGYCRVPHPSSAWVGSRPAPWSVVQVNLLPCRNPRGNQADVVHVRLVAHVDHFGYRAVIQVRIALYEHRLVRALPRGENLCQLRLQR